ncbi:O-antigen ligase family protein [Acetobacter suratthaniensis]|uniref:O-antigen ligase family protein n=1 Tax=Acetobacter suratthaniensis TaxID=1502841 RepID=A0ABS3LPA7_9PROT|nr:O-antigen ligase family protein [Acetobacter suratthaniensis]MBO1329186.1 O-antigen ligase family protein [Acetobacter suratthaniensis]MCX2567253.1 O-antigen ligase family protein [Acetobacter suratthaniensis]
MVKGTTGLSDKPGSDAMTALRASMGQWWNRFATQWRDTPRPLLHQVTLLVLAAGFVLYPEPIWADVFYILMLPLALRALWHAQAQIRQTLPAQKTGMAAWRTLLARYWRSLPVPTQLAVVIIAWFTASLTWDARVPFSPGLIALWTLNVVCTLAFVLSLDDGLRHGRQFRERLICVLIGAGMVNLLIVFARLPFLFSALSNAGPFRMTGWAASRHQIIGAIIIGTIVLLALDRLCRHSFARHKPGVLPAGRLLCAAVCCMGFLFMVLTGSRGPVGSMVVAAPLLAFWANPRLALKLTAGLLLLAAVPVLLTFPTLHHAWQMAMERGDSSRLAIWRTSWEAIQQHPWLGYGPTYHLARIHNESFPHNLFLSAWVYNGVVGLGLLLVFMLSALRAALVATPAERPLAVILLLFTTLCAMTDMSQIARGPSMMWYLFWLPLLFVASTPARTNTPPPP